MINRTISENEIAIVKVMFIVVFLYFNNRLFHEKWRVVYSRKCASEIVNFRSNPYRKQYEFNVLADIALL